MNAPIRPSPFPAQVRTSPGPTARETRRITRWISDAFAVLCVRTSGRSKAEKHLRLGFETILRELGSSPLHAVMSSPLPVYAPPFATPADLRLILHALDACLATFSRYSANLDTTQRRVEARIKETRAFAHVVLEARTTRRPDVASPDPGTGRPSFSSVIPAGRLESSPTERGAPTPPCAEECIKSEI